MTVSPELESPRPVSGPGFSDAVTVAFGDPGAEVYGLARVGLTADAASGLAVLFRGRATVAGRAEGGAARDGDWDAVRAGGVSTRIVEPLSRWTVSFDGGDEGAFDLDVSALGEPAVVAPDSAAGAAGGMEGYEHLVRVRGTVRTGGEELAVDCLGQRGHSWGEPDWSRMALARSVGAWLGDDLGVVLSAIRPAKAAEHGDEAVTGAILEGQPVVPVAIDEPLLSTTYDGERRQIRAGYELWPPGDDSYPRRGAGEVLCGTSLDLGRLRMDCAFFRWRMEGREGVGRYDVVQKM